MLEKVTQSWDESWRWIRSLVVREFQEVTAKKGENNAKDYRNYRF